MAILDFSKAFDTVPHKKLLHKLDQYGIRGPVHRWLTNFLTKRKMRVTLGESSQQVSTIRDSTRPHTISLSHKRPTRRSQIISKTLCRWLLVVPWNQQPKRPQQTTKSRENLEKWAENWGMRFNATKCYIMSIKKKTHKLYQLGGHILEQVDSNP